MLGRNVIFSAPFLDRRLIFLSKILLICEYLIYDLLGPLVCQFIGRNRTLSLFAKSKKIIKSCSYLRGMCTEKIDFYLTQRPRKSSFYIFTFLPFIA